MSYDAILGLNTIPEASGEMDGTSLNGLRAPGLGIPFGVLVPMSFDNRLFMGTNVNGNTALNFPATYGYGEWAELRMTSNFTASQFQGIFMRVQSLVANTSGVRGLEINARNNNLAMGNIEAIFGEADFKGTAGYTVGTLYGITGQCSGDTGSTATITAGAALRAKWQTEAGMTLSGCNGIEISNEAISTIGLLNAAILIKSTSAGIGYGAIIDATGTKLTADGTEVTLIAFLDNTGATKLLVWDSGGAGLVVE